MSKAGVIGAVIGVGLLACGAVVVLRVVRPSTAPVPAAVGHQAGESDVGHESGGHVTKHPIVVSPSAPAAGDGLDAISPAGGMNWPQSPALEGPEATSPALPGPSFLPDPTRMDDGFLGGDSVRGENWPGSRPSHATQSPERSPLSSPRVASPDGTLWPHDRVQPRPVSPR
jgi:hypothetical protein